jgi:hypothetical protein
VKPDGRNENVPDSVNPDTSSKQDSGPFEKAQKSELKYISQAGNKKRKRGSGNGTRDLEKHTKFTNTKDVSYFLNVC